MDSLMVRVKLPGPMEITTRVCSRMANDMGLARGSTWMALSIPENTLKISLTAKVRILILEISFRTLHLEGWRTL